MSFPIQTQSQQFAGFEGDAGHYAQRDRVAVFDIEADAPEFLAGPAIHTGLNNTRHAASPFPIANPWHPGQEEDSGEYAAERARSDHEHGFDMEPPPVDSPYGGASWEDQYGRGPEMHEGHPHEEQGHYDDYDIGSPENVDAQFSNGSPPPPSRTQSRINTMYDDLPSFNTAHRRIADDGGSDFQAFQPNLYSPAGRADAKSELAGREPERWVTAAPVAPAQPAPPADPVWLGHAYVPGHRVGMPWRDIVLPGTVTHLEGTNVGVRWDDGQHSTEEAGAIQPLY